MKDFIKKYKEPFLYLFFGGLTFLVSVGTYAFFNVVLSINELVANILSWILSVLFAFFTNRIWVFTASTENLKGFLIQMASFFSGRVITLLIEEGILFLFITQLHFGSVWVKCAAQIVVIFLNYIISKIVVFRK